MASDPLDALRLPVLPVAPHPDFTAGLLRRLGRGPVRTAVPTATVRYFVRDVDTAVTFYRDVLGFELRLHPSPAFAMLTRGDLGLWLSLPDRQHVLPDGRTPSPGGWNRVALPVDDVDAALAGLRGRAPLLTGVVEGVSVRSLLVSDPSGNPVELYESRPGT